MHCDRGKDQVVVPKKTKSVKSVLLNAGAATIPGRASYGVFVAMHAPSLRVSL